MRGDFERAVELVLKHEGGYVNDPDDPGGETNFGISKRAYPNENIKGMTRDRAKQIYQRDYWDRVKGDELPWAIAVIAFDMAVNAGVGTSIKLLQESLGVTVDGVLGPVTIAKAHAAGRATVVKFSRARIMRYSGMQGWPKFGKAWTQRTLETMLEAYHPAAA
jgi:lysozyme family protein